MRDHGADRIYAKKMSPNDNSKNQVYLGGGFGALNIIPHGEIITDTRPMAGSKQDRPKARVNFFWLDTDGRHPAPDAQLILYPDYPEVRMSGFLKGCKAAPSNLMTVRDPGRVFGDQKPHIRLVLVLQFQVHIRIRIHIRRALAFHLL